MVAVVGSIEPSESQSKLVYYGRRQNPTRIKTIENAYKTEKSIEALKRPKTQKFITQPRGLYETSGEKRWPEQPLEKQLRRVRLIKKAKSCYKYIEASRKQ